MNAEIIVNGLDVQKEEQLHNKKTENASKIRITKEKMNTLFYKLASSEKIRTLKEKAINPDSLKNNNDILNYDSPTKAYKRLDHDLGLENYIPTDCISLLSDNNILNLNIGEIEKEINLKDNGLSDKESNNKCPNDILLSQDNFCYQSTRNQTRETNPLSASMNPFNKQSITSKNDLNKSFQFKTPTNKAKPSKLIRDTTKKSFTKNNNKNDQLNRSMILSKPKNSSLIKKRLGKPSINGNITSCFKNKIQSNDNTQNDKSSMIIIEEYDYSKLLKDLHSIFGEELEYFDEELLFETLDDQSSKGLIKGLLLLANKQGKRLKTLGMLLSKNKSNYQSNMRAKDAIIENLTKQLATINHNLKGSKK